MFHEYALEPTVLRSRDTVRYFLDAFGPWKGRFLFRYPDKKWLAMVRDFVLSPECEARDIEKHWIIERLNRMDEHIFSPRRAPYDKAQPWRANATNEHARRSFRAVIVAEAPSEGAFIEADAVSEEHPLWRVEPGAAVARDPASIVRALDLLIRRSSHVVVVDAYFRADQGDKLDALLHLCRAMRDPHVVIDVHACDAVLAHHEFSRIARRAVPQNLPPGMSVTFRSWTERRGGERFHNRYVITDVGGVQFGDGIERGDVGQFDRLSLLGHDERLRLWNLFYGAPPGFDLAGELKISATS